MRRGCRTTCRKEIIVALNADERQRLSTVIQKYTGPARQVLKVRILLKVRQAVHAN
jgi:hypothetical protein